MEFIDKRNRVWEVFTDCSYFDCICVRLKADRFQLKHIISF